MGPVPGFEELYERTKDAVLKYIAARCMNISDIEDIYQETYLRVCEALRSGREIKDPEAFVMGIAKHCVARYYTVMQRLKMRLRLSAGGAGSEFSDDEDIEELAADRDMYERIYEDICSCPPEVQRIFYLRYRMELSLAETAQAMGISEGRVRQLLYSTVRRLKRKYGRSDGK